MTAWAGDSSRVASPLVVSPPEKLVTFDASESPHDNIAKPVRLGDGRLLALSIWTQGHAQKMVGRYSADSGTTWSAPQPLFLFPDQAGEFGYFDAFTDRDGEVHIFYLSDEAARPQPSNGKPARAGEVLDIWQVKSTGRATHWEPARNIWKGRAGDIMSVIQLQSGRILLPISYKTSRSWGKRGDGHKAFTFVGAFSASAIYSDDGGDTWKQSPDELTIPTPDLFAIGAAEPVVLELKDGRVWMLIRSQMGRYYESFSSDGGERWSAARPSAIVASESPVALVRLPDQRILMIWNEAERYPYAYGGRHVLHAAVSADEGRTWIGRREIVRDPARKDRPPPNGDWGVSYAFPALAPNGTVVFSLWVETGNAKSLFRLDPRWLEQTRQQTSFEQGAGDWTMFGTRGAEPSRAADGTSVLAVRRAASDWPSGAVWNFPAGESGRLRLRLRLREGFGGNNLGLTDHYSVPFDDQDTFHNVFNLSIDEQGLLLGTKLVADRWYDVELRWNTREGKCEVMVNGKRAGSVPAQRVSNSINYLRLRPLSDKPDGGLWLQTAEADVAASANNANLR
ncbi:MAG: exo-alpha-sialidase [Acidobacteria bacterium]|nr:exo-alpha-sialidase [Acidobacteriota bacterium]